MMSGARNIQGIGMTSARTRDRLVKRLEQSGIKQPEIIERIRNVPRHLFVDEALSSRAYEDNALPIGQGQTISQPFIVALMTQALLENEGELLPLSKVLEIGTGFHRELSGRENIFLNGTILGMTKTEINNKFKEIVEFSEIGKFIDTPVKRYSSGMYVRLAFAVAAHLDPEILIVDEVLAVGDAAFQKKCLGKMSETAKTGRTVLFVSHNMGAVRSLCTRGILLKDGHLAMDGDVDQVINAYLTGNEVSTEGKVVFSEQDIPDDNEFGILSVELLTLTGEVKSTFQIDEGFEIHIKYKIIEPVKNQRINLRFITSLGETVFATYEDAQIREGYIREPGTYKAICHIPPNLLNNLTYRIRIGFDSPGYKVLIPGKEYLRVDIVDTSEGYRYAEGAFDGPIRPKTEWSVEDISS